MNPADISVAIIAGTKKCLEYRIAQGKSCFDLALAAVQPLGFAEIIVVSDHVKASPFYRTVNSGATAYHSTMNGIRAARTDYVLIVSADLPHITKANILQLLGQVEQLPSMDAYLTFADTVECEAFGHYTKHALVLNGQRVKSGSVFVVRRAAMEQIAPTIERVLTNRKKVLPVVLALVDLGTLFQFGLALLTHRPFPFERAAAAISRKIGIKVGGINCQAGLAMDDDHEEDPV